MLKNCVRGIRCQKYWRHYGAASWKLCRDCIGANDRDVLPWRSVYLHRSMRGAVTGGIAGLVVPLWMFFGYIMLAIRNNGIPGRTDMCHLPMNTSVGNSSLYVTIEEAITSLIFNSSECTTATLSDKAMEPLARIYLFYSVSFAWYPTVGLVVTLAVGVIVSILINLVFRRHPPVEKQLLFPFLRVCLRDAEMQVNENMDGPINDQNISLLNLEMNDTKQEK